jgi:uncharacterized protein YqgQ
MSDMIPVSLCLATQELFDVKRYQQNFGDFSVLRSRDTEIESILMPIKKELTSGMQDKYLHGHKAVIISNIDKIISLVAGRYMNINIKSAESVIKNGKWMIKMVAQAQSFQEILALEPVFKSKIVLPVYSMFLEYNKLSSETRFSQ